MTLASLRPELPARIPDRNAPEDLYTSTGGGYSVRQMENCGTKAFVDTAIVSPPEEDRPTRCDDVFFSFLDYLAEDRPDKRHRYDHPLKAIGFTRNEGRP